MRRSTRRRRRPPSPAAAPAAQARASGRRAGHARATIRSPRPSCRARAQQAGFGEGDLAYRVRSLRLRPRLCGRRLFGIFPTQRSGLVGPVIARSALRTPRSAGARLREVLIDDVSLVAGAGHAVPADLLHHRRRARAEGEGARAGRGPDGDAATLDVMAALQKFPASAPTPKAFIEALDPLQPRLYSISSSPKAKPGALSLTVDSVRYGSASATPRRRLDFPRRAHQSRRRR